MNNTTKSSIRELTDLEVKFVSGGAWSSFRTDCEIPPVNWVPRVRADHSEGTEASHDPVPNLPGRLTTSRIDIVTPPSGRPTNNLQSEHEFLLENRRELWPFGLHVERND